MAAILGRGASFSVSMLVGVRLTPTSIDTSVPITCSSCVNGKGTQSPHHRTTHNHHLPAGVISIDTIGHTQPPSQLDHRHIFTSIDASTRFAQSIPIRSRSELTTIIPQTLEKMTRTHNQLATRFHSDKKRNITSTATSSSRSTVLSRPLQLHTNLNQTR